MVQLNNAVYEEMGIKSKHMPRQKRARLDISGLPVRLKIEARKSWQIQPLRQGRKNGFSVGIKIQKLLKVYIVRIFD